MSLPQTTRCFSALQRAENSSIIASFPSYLMTNRCFSALQRAENSSIAPTARMRSSNCVFQCSSASRKFLNRLTQATQIRMSRVSVLFSEPKIPQLRTTPKRQPTRKRFSALQRAENSSIGRKCLVNYFHTCFSALQRAENSSIE